MTWLVDGKEVETHHDPKVNANWAWFASNGTGYAFGETEEAAVRYLARALSPDKDKPLVVVCISE